jgi:hypothetical protein
MNNQTAAFLNLKPNAPAQIEDQAIEPHAAVQP